MCAFLMSKTMFKRLLWTIDLGFWDSWALVMTSFPVTWGSRTRPWPWNGFKTTSRASVGTLTR